MSIRSFTPPGEPFAWQDHSALTTVATVEHVGQLNRDGYFVIEDAFHPDTIDDLLDAVAESSVNAPTLDASTCEALRSICTHPLLAGLARDFIGPDARVHSDRLVVRPPHQRDASPFHQHVVCGEVGPTQFFTCWLALTNATIANGCLSIARGRHRVGTMALDAAGDLDIADVEVRAGSVVVLSTLTPRRPHRNTTDRPAMAYVINYVRDESLAADALLPVVRGGQLVGHA